MPTAGSNRERILMAMAGDNVGPLPDDAGNNIDNLLIRIAKGGASAGMIADAYDATSTYSKDDLCTHEGKLYKAKQDIGTAEAWTAAHWDETTLADELGSADPEAIAAAVTDWLGDHVDPDTGYVIDDTFSVENAAPDSKKTGQELNSLKSAISENKANIDDVALMASVNHSLRLPTAVATVDLTDPTAWTGVDATIGVQKNVFDPVNRIHRNCIKITSTANGYAYCDLSSAVDATKKPLLLSVALDDTYDLANGRGIMVQLFSGSGRTSAYREELYIQYEGNTAAENYEYYHNGFFNLCFFPQSGAVLSSGGSFDPTNVTALGIHLKHSTGSRVAYVADLKFVEPMKKPGIITIVDNFGTQVPAMADYAYSKGVRLNLSIIPGFYEGSSSAPTCASKTELDRVAAQGHFIWNHTYEHLNLNNLTDLQIANQINLAETWMVMNGYGDGAKYVSVPSASFGTDSFKSVMKTNVNMVFHKWGYKGRQAFCPFYPCVRQLPTTEIDSANDHSAATLIAEAKKGLENGGISIMGFHGTYWDNDDGDSWKAYIDGIAELENVYHYRLDEIFNGLWC